MIRIGIDGHNLEKSEYGVGHYVSQLLAHINAINTVRDSYEFFIYFKERVPDLEVLKAPNIQCKVLRFIKPSFTLFYNVLIPFASWKDKIDIFWFPSYMLPLLYFGRSIVTIHDIVFEDHPGWVPFRYRVAYKVLSRYAGARATAITTVSKFSKERIHATYKTPHSKIYVVYPGVGEVFRRKRKNSETREITQKYGISAQRFLLFAGQIFTRRYVTESILAFAHIAERYPDVQFLIIGRNMTNPYIDIDALCTYYNKTLGREIFVRQEYAQQVDLNMLFQASEAFVYISTYEGFGMPPVEAAVSGRATVTYDYGPLKENVRESSYLVRRPRKPRSIAMVFKSVLDESPERRKERGERARKCAKRFSWTSSAHAMVKVFEAVLPHDTTATH